MSKTTYYEKEKRLEKFSKEEILDLTFDLINAFSLVRNPSDSADLIKDLLTADEIKDLAKRLRIAKLLLKGESQRDIASSLHCSLVTVTKVSIWIQASGNTLRNVIAKLPPRYKLPEKLPRGPIEFHAPQALLATAQYILALNQTKKVEKFISRVEGKTLSDKIIKEALKAEFRDSKRKKVK